MRQFSPLLIVLTLLSASLCAQTWQSVNRAGGMERDMGRKILVTKSGNRLISGTYEKTMTVGGDSLFSLHGKSAFLACFNKLDELQWVQQAHIKEGEDGLDLAEDAAGNLYWAGSFWESVRIGEVDLQADNSVEIFLAKFTSDGELIWAKSVAQTNYLKPWFGGEPDLRMALAVHPEGGVYVGGTFQDTARIGDTTMVSQGGYDGFLLRLDDAGNQIWVQKPLGGEGNEWVSDLAVDSVGNLSLAGRFEQEFQMETFFMRTVTPWSYFLCKFAPDGFLLWADEIGSANRTDHASVAVGRKGDIVLTGGFESSYFLHKYDHFGHRIWKMRGGSNFMVSAVQMDAKGNSYVCGSFEGILDLGDPEDKLQSKVYGRDVFVAKFQSDGKLEWLTSGGGEYYDIAYHLALDGQNGVWVIGNVRQSVVFGKHEVAEIGSVDMFWGQIK